MTMFASGEFSTNPVGERGLGTMLVAALVVCVGAAGLVGCNTHPVEYEGDEDAASEREGPPTQVRSIEKRETVVTPWSYVVGPDLLEKATVEENRIVFRGNEAAERARSFSTMDILASKDREHPFLRRITGIEEKDSDEVVVETRKAAITEALYKAEFSTARRNGSEYGQTESGGTETRNQNVSGSLSLFPEGTNSFVYNGTGVTGINLSASASPTGRATVDKHLSFEVDPTAGNTTPSNWVYRGERSCSSDSDCHRGEFCDAGTCAYRSTDTGDLSVTADGSWWDDDRHTCDDLTKALELMRNSESCKQKWKTYWQSGGTLARSNHECPVYGRSPGPGRGRVHRGDMPPPYRAQVTWAKRVCTGTLKSAEFNLSFEAEAALENVSVSGQGSGWVNRDADGEEGTKIFEKTVFGPGVYFVGWLPVWYRMGFEFSFESWVGVDGSGSVNFQNPIGMSRPIRLETGIHYYADAQERREGRFGEPGEPTGQWHPNEAANQGPEFHDPSPQYQGELGVGLTATPEAQLTLWIYELAGPYARIRAPKITMEAQGGVSGGQTGARTPHCTLGARAGVSGSVGFETNEEPFTGSSVTVNHTVFASCSEAEGYCGNPGPLCLQACFSNDCSTGPVSSREICTDRNDNDGDGDVDCDDSDCPGTNSEQSCDGKDNDCDGQVDEGLKNRCHVDGDGDGYGSRVAGEYCASCLRIGGVAPQGGDCDDSDSSINPAATEKCNAQDDNCDGNRDTSCLVPCNYQGNSTGVCGSAQKQPTSSTCPEPPAYESREVTCDGRDNDCDGQADEASAKNTCYVDGDGDGYGGRKAGDYCKSCLKVGGAVANNNDCDDSNASANPGASEQCNSVDDDCDGQVNEGSASKNTCYVDGDGDGYGGRKAGDYCRSCLNVGGAVANNNDCDDSNGSVNPGASEQCNSVDDDCDGRVNEGSASKNTCYADGDGDGYGSGTAGDYCRSCLNVGGAASRNGDCDDSNNSINPGASETCNGADDDCDGRVDEGTTTYTCYVDGDGDGYGGRKAGTYCRSCLNVGGAVSNSNDCDDSDSNVNPSESETCNGTDDDCDGRVDEGTTKNTCYVDGDSDGYGDRKAGTYCRSCLRVGGAVSNSKDCDDSDSNVNPGESETCNGTDDDCDALVDEGTSKNTCYVDGDGDGYGGSKAGTYCRSCLNVGGAVGNDDDCNDSDSSVYPGTSCGSRWCQVCQNDGTCRCP